MSIRLDISKGIDPIPVVSDIRNDDRICYVDGIQYKFVGTLPFTLKSIRKNGYHQYCADKELILKHANQAIVRDLRTLESLDG